MGGKKSKSAACVMTVDKVNLSKTSATIIKSGDLVTDWANDMIRMSREKMKKKKDTPPVLLLLKIIDDKTISTDVYTLPSEVNEKLHAFITKYIKTQVETKKPKAIMFIGYDKRII